MKIIAESAGASVGECLRIVVYVKLMGCLLSIANNPTPRYTTDMYRFRPLVNEAQKAIWNDIPFPPRTIVEVSRLNQDDIVEIESTFAVPGTSQGH